MESLFLYAMNYSDGTNTVVSASLFGAAIAAGVCAAKPAGIFWLASFCGCDSINANTSDFAAFARVTAALGSSSVPSAIEPLAMPVSGLISPRLYAPFTF